MRLFKILAGVAILAVFGFAAFSYYTVFALNNELNRKRTEPARAARWKKEEIKSDEQNEKENENEENN